MLDVASLSDMPLRPASRTTKAARRNLKVETAREISQIIYRKFWRHRARVAATNVRIKGR